MRITQNMLTATANRNLAASRKKFTRAQQVLATGKRVLKPSDDPAASKAILRYRSRIASLEQYQDNITSGQARLAMSDSALEAVDKLLHEARSIAVSYSGDSNDASRQTAVDVVKDIYDQIKDMANMRYGGQYLFAGHKSDEPPVTRDADYTADWSGDDGDVLTAIGDGIQVSLNAGGKRPFGRRSDGTLVFDTLKNIIHGLEAGDSGAVAGQAAALDQAIVQVRNVQGENAAVYDRLQSTRTHWEKVQMDVDTLLADTENADLTEAAVEMQLQQIAYEAALSATSGVISQTLLDFLK